MRSDFYSRGFERPHRRRAHGDDAPAACPAVVDGGCGAFIHLPKFSVHFVIAHIVCFHGSKRARPDVEQDSRNVHAQGFDSREQVGGEMKPGSGGRNRAAYACVNRLVPRSVRGVARATNIGRQRHLPLGLDQIIQRASALKAHAAIARVQDIFDNSDQVGSLKCNSCPNSQSPCGTRHHFPTIAVWTEEQNLDCAARARAIALEPRGKYPGFVQHQAIAGAQKFGQVAKYAMGNRPLSAIHHHETRPIALGRWVLGDQVFG